MSANLHDRLADLAESAPKATAYDGLWERGRSFGRRRTAAAVGAVVCCLVLLVAGGALSWQALAPMEASPATGGKAGLPDRFFAASPWLEGTDDRGPNGPLIAVFPAERKSWSAGKVKATTTQGVVGVSATTGEYRFLDLPDRSTAESFDSSGSASLSPDGRHVAYWITGKTSAQPHTKNATEVVVGYAVFDTVTGEVASRELFITQHGLAGGSLVWVDEETLVVDYNQYQDGWEKDTNYASGGMVWLRDLSESDARVVPHYWGSVDGATASGQLMIRSRPYGFDLIDAEQPDSRRRITTSLPTRDGWLLTPDARTVVGLWAGPDPENETGLAKPLIVGTVGSSNRVGMHKVPEYLTQESVRGWRDATHVLSFEYGSTSWVVSIDIRTGAAENLARMDVLGLQLATGLMGAPVVEASAPPTPLDPRLKLGLSIAGILAGLAGLAALARWRFRARP